MSVDLAGLIDRIPQEKINELVSAFTADTTEQEVIDFLSTAGVDASDEEVHALMASLLLKDDEMLEVSDEDLEKVAGGEEGQNTNWYKIVHPDGSEHWIRYMCPNCYM